MGGARAVIEDGKNGILVPMNNINKLSKAMKLVAMDTSFARRLSNESVKIADTFNVKKIARRWEELF